MGKIIGIVRTSMAKMSKTIPSNMYTIKIINKTAYLLKPKVTINSLVIKGIRVIAKN
jgi:hypothetical protein